MAWWLGSISSKSAGNWDLCKAVQSYGVPGVGIHASSVRVDDRLMIWLGGKGYVASCTVTSAPRVPKDHAEAPWSGGLRRFSWVIPFRVDCEVEHGWKPPFTGSVQTVTGVTKNMLMMSFVPMLDRIADLVVEQLCGAPVEHSDLAG